MKFALELESKSLDFYEGALKLISTDELKSTFQTLKESCTSRISTLERIRRENVTEMILEPIKGLDSGSYVLELDISDSSNDETLSTSAISIEETRKHFYEKGSLKIEFLIEAATAFDRLADENQDNIDLIRLRP
ncbi:MAG: hypothetical protein ACXAEF_16025 [Candidatus Thorarchaeota archaeon]|jgi:hypothetical protein